jgi:antitoxin (DNA-binding transcriptional repressor) of toxin-antitoxin stability system
MKVAGIRELKDRLSDYSRAARAGETVLATDRGQAIAEIRPMGNAPLSMDAHPGLVELCRQGRATLGADNTPEAYPRLPSLAPEGAAAQMLDELRGER